jgi:hypothetical protein
MFKVRRIGGDPDEVLTVYGTHPTSGTTDTRFLFFEVGAKVYGYPANKPQEKSWSWANAKNFVPVEEYDAYILDDND